jgi:predicted permease
MVILHCFGVFIIFDENRKLHITMDTTTSLFEGVIMMVAVITLANLLKHLKVLNKDDSLLFSKLVVKVTLPAVIFSSLAIKTFNTDFVIMALIMAVVELVMMVLAWFIAKVLRFEKGETGALILVSAFGMTSLLGYPIIRQAFPGSALAMEEAVVTSEFGVGLLLFILGPLIAMYYGESKVEGKEVLSSVKKFFISPIFISLVAGIAVSFVPVNKDGAVFSSFIRFFTLVGHANLFFVALVIGLILEVKKIKHIYLFLGLTILLKLIIKPLLAVYLTDLTHVTEMMREIVLIETALPSAILTVVFAKQYNCRPDLVSMSIMATLVVSVVSVSLLFVSFF